MNSNNKNKMLKDLIIQKFGTYQNFANKTGYSRMYISNVLNGKNPMSESFKQVLEISLGIDLKCDKQIKISPRNLVDYLMESSSLRPDLLNLVIGVIKDTFNNIDLTDELCARVNNQTYEFIKGWKQ